MVANFGKVAFLAAEGASMEYLAQHPEKMIITLKVSRLPPDLSAHFNPDHSLTVEAAHLLSGAQLYSGRGFHQDLYSLLV